MRYRAAIIPVLLVLTISVGSATRLSNETKISLQFESVSIVTVLNMIAQQNGLNLVVSGEIEKEVSVRLENVGLAAALEALLAPNGLNYYLTDGIIVVKPVEVEAIGELESRVILLKYLSAVTALKAAESRKSERGSVIILDRTLEIGGITDGYVPNRILVTDFPTIVDEMSSLIDEMDQPERMISIEVKIIETTIDSESKLGFSWPTSLNSFLGTGTVSESQTSTTGSSSTSSSNQIDNAALALNPNTGHWTWGALTADQLRLVLDVLNSSGNSKLVSDPHLTTLENHQAEIKVQTIVPIPTVSRFTQGSATQDIMTFEDQEVGISLLVTPRINEDGAITLEVEPKVQDIVRFTGPPESQKPITTERSLKTTITVREGETAALGGLLKEGTIQKVRRVPLLSSIPLLGKLLFTHTSVEKTTTDLIILITPRIMK